MPAVAAGNRRVHGDVFPNALEGGGSEPRHREEVLGAVEEGFPPPLEKRPHLARPEPPEKEEFILGRPVRVDSDRGDRSERLAATDPRLFAVRPEETHGRLAEDEEGEESLSIRLHRRKERRGNRKRLRAGGPAR